MRLSWLLLGLLSVACVEQAPARDYGDPTSREQASQEAGIYATLLAPKVLQVFDTPEVEFVVAAWTDEVLPLEVRVFDADGNQHLTQVQGEPGPDQRFTLRLPLLHGHNPFRIRIASIAGSRVRRFDYDALYEGVAPGLRVALGRTDDEGDCSELVPLPDNVTGQPNVCVFGRVSAGSTSIDEASVQIADTIGIAVQVDKAGRFAGRFPLERDQASAILVTVVDSAARSSSAEEQVIQDSTPPELSLDLGNESPLRTADTSLELTGTATDQYGVAQLSLENGVGRVQALALAEHFSTTVELEAGANSFTVIARDRAGNEARQALSVLRERVVHLGLPSQNDGATDLGLDRQALVELLSEEDQRAIEVLRLKLRPSILNAFEQIRDPEQYGLDTSAWGTAEWNLQRLLNMTPDTANLQGTSIEELLQIASSVGLPPARVLGELLSLEVTDTFVDLPTSVDATLDGLVATHPNVVANSETGEPEMSLSMYDVLQELETVAPRFGPAGEHPGFLSGTSHSAVFEPGFLMSIPVRSNFTKYDGVDASLERKDYLFDLQGGPALDLDFDSDRFTVVGLVDEPEVDLRVVMPENPAFLLAGATRLAGEDSEDPGFYRGDSALWTTKPWELEHIVAETIYRQYHRLYEDKAFEHTLRYDAGSIKDAAIVNWSRGWLDIHTSGGIGDPPEPLYVWDMLSEVAQVRLHEGGLLEGEAGLAFRLEHLSIGLTAEQLIESLRPTLEAQKEELSRRLVGDAGLAASSVDFYFVPAAEPDAAFLFFRAPSDSSREYLYQTPGFFADAELRDRVSSKQLVGSDDTAHEKVLVRTNDVLFMQDDTGAVYRLTVVESGSRGVSLRIVPEVSP